MSTESFLLSALFLFSVITFAVTFSKKMGLGSILGLLVAGIIVGPYTPGPVLSENVETIRHFTEFGVVLLLFLIGLEMQPQKLWAMRRDVFGMGFIQILVSSFVIFLYIVFYVDTWQSGLLISLTFSLSSTAFVMQLLHERGEFHTLHGRGAFAVLLMQDLAVVPLLAIVPLLADKGALAVGHSMGVKVAIAIGMIGAVVVLGKYIIPIILEKLAVEKNHDGFVFLTILSVVFAAWAMEHAGLSMALGAFLMGMMLSKNRLHLQVQAHIEPYKGLLMSLFFVAVGMSIDIQTVSKEPLLVLQHIMVIMGLKVLVLFLVATLFGYSKVISYKMAFLLSQNGEFGFVLFGSAMALGVISTEMFAAGVAVISLSMAFTPLAVKIGDILARNSEENEINNINTNTIVANHDVVIAGYGRVGHIVASMLSQSDISFIAYDTDIQRVEIGQKEFREVLYGDMSNHGFLSHLDLSNVKLIVVTVDVYASAARTISYIKNNYPDMVILARSKDDITKDRLLQHGATWVLPVTIEGSLRLGAEVLSHLGKEQNEVDTLLRALRTDDYKGINLIQK